MRLPKEMTLDRGAEAGRATEELQGRLTVRLGLAMHMPAVAAVVMDVAEGWAAMGAREELLLVPLTGAEELVPVEFKLAPLGCWLELVPVRAEELVPLSCWLELLDATTAWEAQHLQAVQPTLAMAEEAQQQPPRHRLLPQSKLPLQGSPGE